jgi:hypothetical protein
MEGLSSEVEGDIRSTKNTDKQIQWRRVKVLELSSQGNTQSIASFPLLDGFKLQDFLFYSITISVIVDLIVSIVLICRVMVSFIQLRIFMVANKNAIKQYWDISQKAQDNKEKIQALEHYLECHQQLWTLLYGGEGHMVRFGKSISQQQYQYKEDELAFTEGKP